MSEFWTSRTPRERLLIGAAVFLAGLLLTQFGIVSPLRAANADARLGLEAASRQLDVVSTEVTRNGPAVYTATKASDQDLRTGLLTIATARGLAVSRLQASDDGRLILQFDSASPTLIYAWLADTEQAYGAAPDRATLFAEDGGVVRASFEFAGAGS